MGPIDYTSMQSNPLQAFQGGLQTGVAIENLQLARQQRGIEAEKQAQAQQQAQEAAKMFRSVADNPRASAADYGALLSVSPGMKDQIKNLYDMKSTEQQKTAFSEATRLHAALEVGRTDLAQKMFEDRIQSLENSNAPPQEIAHQKAMMEALKVNPGAVRAMAGSLVMAMPEGDKYFLSKKVLGEEARANEKFPSDIAATKAATQKTITDTEKTSQDILMAPTKALIDAENISSQITERKSAIQDRNARLGLDREKFNLEFDQAVAKLNKENGDAPKLSAGMEKVQADSIGESIVSRSMAERADVAVDALNKFKTSVGGKPLRWLAENSKKILGSEDGFSTIKREFIRLRSKDLLADLPPGPASNYDIQNVKKGYPDDNAEPEVISEWLKSFANVQRAISQKEEAKAEWLSAVGSLRTAPKDIEVMGVKVPAGMSFVDFTRSGLKKNAPPTLDDLFKKYPAKSSGATGAF